MSHEIRFLSVTIRNFFTYGNVPTTIKLDVPGCILIEGVDLDNIANGVGANGVGKSTILHAMLYLYGHIIPTGMSIDDIVNNISNKDCVVSGEVMVDGDVYTITKYRKSSEKPEKNYFEIFKNGDTQHNLAKGTSSEVVKQISDIIGIQPDMLKRILMFDVNDTHFFRESGPKQREIMEDLFALNELAIKADRLSDTMKTTKSSLVIAENDFNTQQRMFDQHNQQIKNVTDSIQAWERTHQEQITQLTTQLTVTSSIDLSMIEQSLRHNSDIDDQIKVINESIAKINNDVQLLTTTSKTIQSVIDGLNREKATFTRNIKDADASITRTRADIAKLEENLCPTCNQVIDRDKTIALIKEKENLIIEIQSTMSLDGQKIVNINNTIIEKNNELIDANSQISNMQTSYQPLVDKISSLRNSKVSVSGSITNQSDIEKLKLAINSLQTKLDVCQAETNPHVDMLRKIELTKPPVPDSSKIDELKLLFSHQQFLYKLLTDKKSFIRKHLIDKKLSILNTRLHHYLQKLGLPHTVIFNNDLTATIAKMGRPVSYGGLSGGQKARLNFALCLSFRDLLQMSNRQIPFLMIDEVLDHGLDDVGVTMASGTINSMAKDQNCTVFLITHKSEIVNRFSRKITVQLKDGFASIVDGTNI